MYGEKATELFNLLKNAGIVGAEGNIKFDLLGTEVNISDKSAMGNLIQEWLSQWMTLNGFSFRVNSNTQVFPDFYLHNESNEIELLEVKTFSYEASPNFDIANFDAYVRSLRTDPYRIDADYLILGYSLSHGVIKINDVWLKKIWEITCPSSQYALRTQVKQEKIINIRPYNFKSMSEGAQPFKTRLDFIKAIKSTLISYLGSEYAEPWFKEVSTSYRKFKGSKL